jgi:hypothetical protein
MLVVGDDILQRALGLRMSAALSEHSNLFSTVAPVLGIGQEVGGHIVGRRFYWASEPPASRVVMLRATGRVAQLSQIHPLARIVGASPSLAP